MTHQHSSAPAASPSEGPTPEERGYRTALATAPAELGRGQLSAAATRRPKPHRPAPAAAPGTETPALPRSSSANKGVSNQAARKAAPVLCHTHIPSQQKAVVTATRKDQAGSATALSPKHPTPRAHALREGQRMLLTRPERCHRGRSPEEQLPGNSAPSARGGHPKDRVGQPPWANLYVLSC